MKCLTLLPSISVISIIVLIVTMFQFQRCEAYNADRAIVKWNPYWFSNTYSRYSAPTSYNMGMSRGGLPKRLGERTSSFGSQIYKWNPNYFADSGWLGRPMGVQYLNRFSDNGNDGLDINTEGSSR